MLINVIIKILMKWNNSFFFVVNKLACSELVKADPGNQWVMPRALLQRKLFFWVVTKW